MRSRMLANPGFLFGHSEKNSRGKNSKLKEKTQNSRKKLNNSRKKLKVLANFDYQVTKYLSNRHKNPSFALY